MSVDLIRRQHELTSRQAEILGFIRSFFEKNGYWPTVRDIGVHFGFTSPNGTLCHLKALHKHGVISWSGKARAMRLIGWRAVLVPSEEEP